jgi:hypothetical protein
MMDIVERVARALADGPNPSEWCSGKARSVIEAMREPDEEMIEAAKDARFSLPEGMPPGVFFARMYRAMIDAALNPDRTL